MVDNADLDDLLKGQDDSIASERVNEKTLKLKVFIKLFSFFHY